MSLFTDAIVEFVAGRTNLGKGAAIALIEIPPEPGMGDYAFPCFALAKEMRKAPQKIAEELSRGFAGGELIERAEARGGYLNFFVNRPRFTAETVNSALAAGASYGRSRVGTGKTVVIDFSSPNIAKPFHVGHLRSTIIGHSLRLIYGFLGYRVVGINHLGDWGTQFGKEIAAFKRWGSEAELSRRPVEHLNELYVRFHKEAESDPSLEEEARACFKRLEDGDAQAAALWERFRRESLREFDRIYETLGIGFDVVAGESFYNEMLDATIDDLVSKGLAVESQGALVVDLERYGMPPCLLRKKDEASLYAARDICAAVYRYRQYGFDRCIYVVGTPQELHFKQVFKVLELSGCDWASRCVHVGFGLVRFKEGKLSSRGGNVVLLEEVLERAVGMARGVVEEKNPEMADKERIAREVGIGAVIFADLSNRRVKDVEFDWERILDPFGETGPYVQYTCARLASVLRKYGRSVSGSVEAGALGCEEEFALARAIEGFPAAVRRAADEYEPSLVAGSLLAVSAAANRFYNNCRVIGEDERLTRNRIGLVAAARGALASGLGLLGMNSPEEI